MSQPFNSSLYIFSDIHGCVEELQLLYEKMKIPPGAPLIFLGDYVDRGPHSKQVIDFILQLQKQHPIVALKGNHEELFMSFLENPSSAKAGVFIYNGGAATLASYANEFGEYDIPKEHIQFLKELKWYHETPDYFFVHAGVPNKPLAEISEEDLEKLIWIRKPFLESDYQWTKLIVHGHTPTEEPELLPQRINIDTGCVYNGHLSALELPAKKIYQVKKQQKLEHVYLKDKSSQRKAVRFSGSVPVQITEPFMSAQNFLATNYSEFGMLLKDQLHSPDVMLQGVVNIKGTIGTTEKMVPFEGRILRHELRDQTIYYAVQFTKTPFDLNKKIHSGG